MYEKLQQLMRKGINKFFLTTNNRVYNLREIIHTQKLTHAIQ
jgi:hypothetical protein